MRRAPLMLLPLVLLWPVLVVGMPYEGSDAPEEKKQYRNEQGANLDVPEDYQVIREGSMVRMESVEQYTGRKFADMIKRIDDLERKLDVGIRELEQRLENLELTGKNNRNINSPIATPAPEPS